MKPEKPLTPIWLQISTYVDRQLHSNELPDFERMLKSNPGLSEEIDSLLEIKHLIKFLPRKKAPRSFTLQPSDIRTTAWIDKLFIPVFSLSSMAVVFFLMFTVWINDYQPLADYSIPAPAMQVSEKAAGAAEPLPGLVYWNSPEQPRQNNNLLMASKSDSGMGAGYIEDLNLNPVLDVPGTPLDGSQPILGIPPKEEQGKIIRLSPIIPPANPVLAAELNSRENNFPVWFQVGLATLFFGFTWLVFYFYKKQHPYKTKNAPLQK